MSPFQERTAWHRMRNAPRVASNADLSGMEMEPRHVEHARA